MLNVLITGAGGQLGQALCRLAAISPNNYLATDAAELDITDREAVEKTVAEQKIDVIINCAAYTDVERAEEDEAAADRLNREAAANLAAAAARHDALLVHVSTDYLLRRRPDGTAERLRPHETGGRRSRRGLGMPLSDPAHGVALLRNGKEFPAHDAPPDGRARDARRRMRPGGYADLCGRPGAGDLLDRGKRPAHRQRRHLPLHRRGCVLVV